MKRLFSVRQLHVGVLPEKRNGAIAENEREVEAGIAQ